MKRYTKTKLALAAVGGAVTELTIGWDWFMVGIALIAGAIFIHMAEEGMNTFGRRQREDGH